MSLCFWLYMHTISWGNCHSYSLYIYAVGNVYIDLKLGTLVNRLGHLPWQFSGGYATLYGIICLLYYTLVISYSLLVPVITTYVDSSAKGYGGPGVHSFLFIFYNHVLTYSISHSHSHFDFDYHSHSHSYSHLIMITILILILVLWFSFSFSLHYHSHSYSCSHSLILVHSTFNAHAQQWSKFKDDL